jgi:hypothetical protein
MNLNQNAKVLTWLQSNPSPQALRDRFPDEWKSVEAELETAILNKDPVQLQKLLNHQEKNGIIGKKQLSKSEKKSYVQQMIRQKMAAQAIQSYCLAVAAQQSSGRIRFNLFNGWLAQKLLFKKGFERKPASMFWFNLLWPLVWQKKLLMPLVELKGIYCFYSHQFIKQIKPLMANYHCLEIGAGDGTLSRFLQNEGIAVIATDNYSWHHKITYPDMVVQMDAIKALEHYMPDVVICSWPPAKNNFEREIFACKSVKLYIAIVSVHKFASGNWQDYESQKNFTIEQRSDLAKLLLPPELGSDVVLFRRIETN